MDAQSQPEPMADFFDVRSDGYEQHMEHSVSDFGHFYASIARPIRRTEKAVRILDIGCGTGLELDPIFDRAPSARVTGIDLSRGMLDELRKRYGARLDQLDLIRGSYLEVPLGSAVYDYVVAVMTLHHLLPATKRILYGKVRNALKEGGVYIEGDWVVPSGEEAHRLSAYEQEWSTLEAPGEGSYHIDVPLSLETQRSLLLEAGFLSVGVIWQSEGNAVYVAHT